MNKSIETVGQRKQVCDPRRMMFKQLKGSREGKGKKQLPITMFLQIKNKNKNILKHCFGGRRSAIRRFFVFRWGCL